MSIPLSGSPGDSILRRERQKLLKRGGAIPTPGPWNALGCNIYAPFESSPVATVRKPEDAPIVAASTDLLEALRAAREFMRGGGCNARLRRTVDAAIAKAEGRAE